MDQVIFYFSQKGCDGNSDMKDILGGKGANLAQMCKMNLPVPPGFTVSSQLCNEYYKNNKKLPDRLKKELKEYVERLEKETGKKLGCKTNPLLISVRSGAKISMPGMMDTILNLGINDEVVEVISKNSGNEIYAYDSYRRFIEMYGSVVLKISHYLFEEIFDSYKLDQGVIHDNDLSVDDLKEIIKQFKEVIKENTGNSLDSDPYFQLENAIKAVFESWLSPRAVVYRKINNIDDSIGTAVNIQSMVFGNMGQDSATGVIFSRNPVNGEKKLFGEFLVNAQGEDIVAGIRTPGPISKTEEDNNSLEELMPEIFKEITDIANTLELEFKDMQDIEFTVEKGKLYILQTRSGKRTAASAIKIAVDMVEEKVIDKKEALIRIDPESLNQLLHTTIDYSDKPEILAKGLPASPGAADGFVVFSALEAEEMSASQQVILVRNDTSPEDIKGMNVSTGFITARGGMTSHAAVVARGMGKPCICGINGISVDEKHKKITLADGQIIKSGDYLTIDGSSGNVIKGKTKMLSPNMSEEFLTILRWADQEKDLVVRANAETVTDTETAINFGADGIGLCRTEHMFFDDNKILLIRKMIIAQTIEQRMEAIEQLKPLHKNDFKSLFRVINGKSLNIRLLDPPLHEFLPTTSKDKKELSKILDINLDEIEYRLRSLHESNPMLGHRGCRLGITYPEIFIMQVESMLEAIYSLKKEENIDCKLELMVPLISNEQELVIIKKDITDTLEKFERRYSMKFNIKIGTMIELPRAALISNKIAKHVEYFSFGSNDLTQTTYGISRDDIGSFLPDYIEKKIFNKDPFSNIDIDGVGELILTSMSRGKKSNKNLKFGICGEHAGDADSISFFHEAGLDYISCSPYRVPIARVAAARSKIISERNKNL